MNKSKSFVSFVSFVFLLFGFGVSAFAGETPFPERSVRLIVPTDPQSPIVVVPILVIALTFGTILLVM